jgi:hypothetical protein
MNTNFKTFQSFFNKCKKSTLPICGIMKVENSIATMTDIETYVRFSVDLKNGYYDLILNEPFFISELPEPEEDDFPTTPSGYMTRCGSINSKDLVLYSAYVSNDELRPAMNGIFINHELIASSNAHVLRWQKHKQITTPDFQAIFTPAIPLIAKCKETDQLVKMDIITDIESGIDKNIQFRFNNCTIIHRLTQGNYPDFMSVVPDFDKQQTNFFSIHSSLVSETLKTSKAFCAKVLQVSDKGFIIENTDTKLFKQFQTPGKAENPNRKPDGIIMPMMISDGKGNDFFNPENGTYLGISPEQLIKFTTLFTGKIVLGWYDNNRAIGVWLYPETKATKTTKAHKPAPIQEPQQPIHETQNSKPLSPSIPQSVSPEPEREAVEGKPETAPVFGLPSSISLQLVKYSDRAVALVGDTRQIKDKLKELWGSYNPHLKINGQTVKGWVFSAKREPQLRQLIAS